MKFKSLMRFVCVVIASAMMCTSTVSAFDSSNNEITTSTVSASANSVDEVISSAETQSASNTVYGSGTHYMGQFTFYDENGGYYHTYKGSRMRMHIAYREADNIYGSADLLVYCYGYSDGAKYSKPLCAGQVEPSSDGYRHYTLDWIPILSGGDYRFIYWAYSCGAGSEARTVTCKVWMEVE